MHTLLKPWWYRRKLSSNSTSISVEKGHWYHVRGLEVDHSHNHCTINGPQKSVTRAPYSGLFWVEVRTWFVGGFRFPSIASFFFLQLSHKKGPSQSFDVWEKKDPACTEMPSSAWRLQRQMAQRNIPFPACTDDSGPSLWKPKENRWSILKQCAHRKIQNLNQTKSPSWCWKLLQSRLQKEVHSLGGPSLLDVDMILNSASSHQAFFRCKQYLRPRIRGYIHNNNYFNASWHRPC